MAATVSPSLSDTQIVISDKAWGTQAPHHTTKNRSTTPELKNSFMFVKRVLSLSVIHKTGPEIE
jgi:light-regulated signal transduction histidine kinase (bacteriophytochrome)